MQVENSQQRSDVYEPARVGTTYLKLWHQGVRRLFDACYLIHQLAPEEMCIKLKPSLLNNGISIGDIETVVAVLLKQEELELEQGQRMAKRYEGQTPLLDALQELLNRPKGV